MADTHLYRRAWMYGPPSDLYTGHTMSLGPLLLFERQSYFTRLPRKLSMVTNITRVFDQMSWIMISLMTFFGFLFLLVVVPISNAYGVSVSPWEVDYVIPATITPKPVSIKMRQNATKTSEYKNKMRIDGK